MDTCRTEPKCGRDRTERSLETNQLITPLHEAALANGCTYRVDETETGKTIVYSVRNLKIMVVGDKVTFSGEYDIRAFLKLYRETNDEQVQKLLFDAAIPCCYCIDDKCTTFLMARERTIEYEGQKKKLCGPYRHNLSIEVNSDNLPACVVIINMMFKHTYPYMHQDTKVTPNSVTYRLTELDTFYLLAYRQKHSPISPSDEEFISSLLRRDESGNRKIDSLIEAANLSQVERFVGAVDSFVNGVSYDFLFGVVIDKKPDSLPEGAVCRKVSKGEWAVYNSSACEYRSVWRHFTERFYELEHKGYDYSRIPFEYYDQEGHFSDVHIPIDADMPADSGIVYQVLHTPNEKLAGFRNYAETDYPLYQDRSFDMLKRIDELFPHSQCVTRVSIHSQFGKPLMGFDGAAVDDLSVIPEGVEVYNMQGGYWKRVGWKHFNGGYEGWRKAFHFKLDSKLPIHDMHHPRGFNQYIYNARGGYVEIGVPMRLVGKRSFEIVELESERIVGKLETPPDNVLTEDDIQQLFTMPENKEIGTFVIGFTHTFMKTQENGPYFAYFDRPFVQGIYAIDGAAIPDGLSVYTLDSGSYVRVTEDIPNGVLGWELHWLVGRVEKRTGRVYDQSRQFIYKQCDYGKRYELFVPVL